MWVEDIRKYKANVKTDIASLEKKEFNKAPIPRSNVRPREREHVQYMNYAPLNAPKSRIRLGFASRPHPTTTKFPKPS